MCSRLRKVSENYEKTTSSLRKLVFTLNAKKFCVLSENRIVAKINKISSNVKFVWFISSSS